MIINDIEKHFEENRNVSSLLNIPQTLRSAVIAFEGGKELYQSSNTKSPKGYRVGDNDVCISLRPIRQYGDLARGGINANGLSIIGLNSNRRITDLKRHVDVTPDSELMFEALAHLIGVGTPRAVISGIRMEIPNSQNELNDEQKMIANPLLLTSAMEVAGPPGTGKTFACHHDFAALPD